MPDLFVSNKKNGSNQTGPKTAEKKNKSDLKRKINAPSTKMLGKKRQKDTHPLSPFRFYPANANFVNKDPEEKVILILRRHFVTNLRWIGITIVLLLSPSFLTVLPFFEAMPSGFKIISLIFWYLFTFAYSFEKFLSWFYHVNIVTDERVFDVDFSNLIHREMTDANIDQIQDVTPKITGAIRTYFNYGDIVIQTAASVPQIEFDAVPMPDKVARILRELRVQEEIEKLEGRVR